MESKTLTVIPVKQPQGEFFIGTISAQDLVDITFSDIRRINNEQRDVEKYLGIQRPLDKARVSKIKKYIQSPDASFPTGIVLAIDPKCAEYDKENSKLILKEYISEFEEDLDENVKLNKIAKVLDGQHRIEAFMNDQGNFDFTLDIKIFELNVVIFIGLDIDEQANIFATINLAQTKVNKSLVYDLEGLSKIRSPFRTAHKIAVALDTADNSSPLYHRIKRLGVKTEGRESSEPLTQAVFVESLLKLVTNDPFHDRTYALKGRTLQKVDKTILLKFPFRNLFIEEKDNDIALIVYNYFKAVEMRWPKSWNDLNTVGNILPKSNAFKAFMRFLKTLYINLAEENIGRVISVDEFLNHFNTYDIKDDDFTSGNFLPGSGGESAFYKVLTKQISIGDLKRK
ncbi:DGQHR domain-containing protein [uncultured Chryseobacterium sp.]|uniref:DGQHR domain-containing protein n=1 Tax=uncultured Chryseobacterium sp. TaxID=259322 RepID=UPI00258C0C5D|nr:DGQHR domain-containing protein [uncultured Chryseobacterium sp.]